MADAHPEESIEDTAATRPTLSRPRLVAFTLLTLVLALVIPELTLRMLKWPPRWSPEANLPGSPYLLWELPRGNSPRLAPGTFVNSLGLRGPELEPKAPGVRRFLTVGDSSIFGHGVAQEEIFSTVVARALGKGVEPVIGAVPGYSTYQSINLLHMVGLATEPDLLIIGNLWSDSIFDSFVDKEELALYAGQKQSTLADMRRFLERYALFRAADLVLNRKDRVRKVGWGMLGQNTLRGVRRVAINDYARNLEDMVQLMKKRGGEAMFVMLADPRELNASRTWPWDPYRKVMRDTARRHGAPVVDVPALFLASGLPRNELFSDDIHPWKKGHALIGDATTSILQKHDWAKGGHVMEQGVASALPVYHDPFVEPWTKEGADALVAGEEDRETPLPAIAGIVRGLNEKAVTLRIDALPLEGDGPGLLDTIDLPKAAPFALQTQARQRVWLRVRLEPSPQNHTFKATAIDFKEQPLDLSKHPAWGVVVDLEKKTLTLRGSSIPGAAAQ